MVRSSTLQYRLRDERLLELGYGSYREYLFSELWTGIRRKALISQPICLLCDQQSTQVHHMSYSIDVLLGIQDELLVCLCRDCHKRIEFDGSRKRSLQKTNVVLVFTAHRRGKHNWARRAGKLLNWKRYR